MSRKVDLQIVLNKHDKIYNKVVKVLNLQPIEPKPQPRLSFAHYATAGIMAIFSVCMPMVYAKDGQQYEIKIKQNEVNK